MGGGVPKNLGGSQNGGKKNPKNWVTPKFFLNSGFRYGHLQEMEVRRTPESRGWGLEGIWGGVPKFKGSDLGLGTQNCEAFPLKFGDIFPVFGISL